MTSSANCDRGRIGQQRDDPVRPDRGGHDDVVGTGLLAASWACWALRPARRSQSFGHICRAVRVMKTFSASLGMTRDQDLGALDAGLIEHLLLGRIAGHAGKPRASAIAARSCDSRSATNGFSRAASSSQIRAPRRP